MARVFEAFISTRVRVRIEDEDVLTRVTGPGGNEWREYTYPDIKTEEDVVKHLAFNRIQNNVGEVYMLDGWADLPRGAASMFIEGLSEIDGVSEVKP